jgi:hypothetical protein
MKFQLHIDLGNTAMQDNHDVAKALRDVADRLNRFTSSGWSPYALTGTIKDANGNAVGGWEVKLDWEWKPVVHDCTPKAKPSRKRSRTP